MINSDSQYSEVVFETLNKGQQESNTQVVNEFDRHNHIYCNRGTILTSNIQTIWKRKRTERLVRFQLTFLLRWTKKKMNRKVEKKCGICRQPDHDHNRNHCLDMPSSSIFFPKTNVIV
ncbi:hypothetical protein GmHk_18G051905 [Glycine max]|nr:hypothetical protein GmHk_18G051905 [Glycine max]